MALEKEGAVLITTSCGFLAAHQEVLARNVKVPVITSSLLQVARHAQAGIVTIAAESLTASVLQGAGVPAGTPIESVAADGEFRQRILSNDSRMDLTRAEQDVVAAASTLMRWHPELTDIVLECFSA